WPPAVVPRRWRFLIPPPIWVWGGVMTPHWATRCFKGENPSGTRAPRTTTCGSRPGAPPPGRASPATPKRPTAISKPFLLPRHSEAVDVRVRRGGGDAPGVEAPLQVADVLREDAHRPHPHHRLDHGAAVVVVPGQAVVGHPRGPLAVRLVDRLDAADDDVGRPLAADVLQRVLHAALADGHQGDDRRGADDDAVHP